MTIPPFKPINNWKLEEVPKVSREVLQDAIEHQNEYILNQQKKFARNVIDLKEKVLKVIIGEENPLNFKHRIVFTTYATNMDKEWLELDGVPIGYFIIEPEVMRIGYTFYCTNPDWNDRIAKLNDK